MSATALSAYQVVIITEGEDVFVRPDDDVEESTTAVGEAECAQVETLESQNPWPHLKDYFVFMARDKWNANILYFRCVMCQPQQITIKGQAASLYNLKSHVKRKHPALAIQFEERTRAGSSRGKHRQSSGGSVINQLSQPCVREAHQPSTGETFVQTAGTGVLQSVVDRRVIDLFVDNMLPLHVVESPTFLNLIKTLNPSKTLMSRFTLGMRILARHKQLEEYLTRYLFKLYSLLNYYCILENRCFLN